MILVLVYIHDDRYSVPTWRTAEITAEQASTVAREPIGSNAHYARVELRYDDTLIAAATREGANAAA